jgi:hypothetical protein
MDHETVIEAIEVAATEPGGLERLMAGDTATSQAVAGHVAGCPTCAAELAAIHRDAPVIADVVLTTPPADLRERTLAAVRERDIARGAAVIDAGVRLASPEAVSPTVEEVAAPAAASRPRGVHRSTLGWIATIAAVMVLSVGVTSALVGNRADDRLAAQSAAIDGMREVTTAAMAVAAQPDATRVDLIGTADPSVNGNLLYSPTSTGLVVVATGLTQPPAGQEYRCWMDAGDGRVPLGRMYFGGGLAYWAGESAAVAGVDGPATFGVSLADVGAPATDSKPVLTGRS